MSIKDIANVACVLGLLLVAAVGQEETVNEKHLQDDNTLNRLSGGAVLKRLGSVRFNTRVANHTFAVPLPSTPADFGWKVDGPCAFGKFVLNCTELPPIQAMQARLERALEQFQGLTALLPQLEDHVEGAQVLDHLLRSNPVMEFAPQMPDSTWFPHYLNTTPDALYGGNKIAAKLQDFPHKHKEPSAVYRNVSPALISYLQHLDPTFIWVNNLRIQSGEILDDIWALLDGQSLCLADQRLSARLGLLQLAELSRAVQGLFVGASSQLLVPQAALQRAMQDYNKEARLLDLPFRADLASASHNPLPVSGAVFNSTLYVTISFYVDPVPQQSYTIYDAVTVPLYLSNKDMYGSVRLIDVPRYLAVAFDGKTYLEITEEQLAGCTGHDNGVCTQPTAVYFANYTQSCLWALYRLARSEVDEHCRFLASMEAPPTAAFQYAQGYVLLTNVGSVVYRKDDQIFTEVKCTGRQCIVKVCCGFSMQTDTGITIDARHRGCLEENPSYFARHVMNLPVGFKFAGSLLTVVYLDFNLFLQDEPPIDVKMDVLRNAPNFLIKGDHNATARVEVRRPPPDKIYIPPYKLQMNATTAVTVSILLCAVVAVAIFVFFLFCKRMNRVSDKIVGTDFAVDMRAAQGVSFQGLLGHEDRDWGDPPSPQAWRRLLSKLSR